MRIRESLKGYFGRFSYWERHRLCEDNANAPFLFFARAQPSPVARREISGDESTQGLLFLCSLARGLVRHLNRSQLGVALLLSGVRALLDLATEPFGLASRIRKSHSVAERHPLISPIAEDRKQPVFGNTRKRSP